NGGRGNDRLFGGAGGDTVVWNPGDGSGTGEGQDGTHTLQFNGAHVDEKIDIPANRSRGPFTPADPTPPLDVNGTEQINFAALGGADTINVGDLTGTGVNVVNLDLSSPAGSGTGDGAADTVIVNGTNGNDQIAVRSSGGILTVNGLSAFVAVSG